MSPPFSAYQREKKLELFFSVFPFSLMTPEHDWEQTVEENGCLRDLTKCRDGSNRSFAVKFGGFTSLPFPPILIGKMCTGPVGSRTYPKKNSFSSPETEISSLDLAPPPLSPPSHCGILFVEGRGKKPPFSDASMRRRNGVVATMSTSPASFFYSFLPSATCATNSPPTPYPIFCGYRREAQKSREESHGKN